MVVMVVTISDEATPSASIVPRVVNDCRNCEPDEVVPEIVKALMNAVGDLLSSSKVQVLTAMELILLLSEHS